MKVYTHMHISINNSLHHEKVQVKQSRLAKGSARFSHLQTLVSWNQLCSSIPNGYVIICPVQLGPWHIQMKKGHPLAQHPGLIITSGHCSLANTHLLATLNCKEGWEMWFLVMLLHAQLQILINGRKKTDFRENCEALPYEVNVTNKFSVDNHHLTQGVF